MLMFAVTLFFSLLGLVILSVPFWIAFQKEADPLPEKSEPKPVVLPERSRFFWNVAVPAARPPVPIEVLLMQIEHHVRSEQAAAESFIESPTSALLHSRTVSPLVN
jgi:hypothetical protein